jgi:hypothetical protein
MRIYKQKEYPPFQNEFPYDIMLHIIGFLPRSDKIKFMRVNNNMYKSAYYYLDNHDIIAFACYKNDVERVKVMLKINSHLTFKYIIKLSNLFDIINYKNLNHSEYHSIILDIIKYNKVDYLRKILPFINNVDFDIIYVKNAFENKCYELFKLLYSLDSVRYKNLNIIFNIACEKGLDSIVRMMIMNPTLDPTTSNNVALITAVKNKHYSIVKLLLTQDIIDVNTNYYCPFRSSIHNNDIEMVEIIMNHPTSNINNINIANIDTMHSKKEIFTYILNHDKTNHVFINTCIYTYILKRYSINIFLKHPKFNPGSLFSNNEHYIASMNTNTLVSIIDIDNMLLMYRILKYYYDSSIINKINDIFTHAKCYNSIKECMLYIMANNPGNINNNYIHDIIINNPNNIFDTKYHEGKYKECSMLLEFVDMKAIMEGLKNKKYSMVAKFLLNFY